MPASRDTPGPCRPTGPAIVRTAEGSRDCGTFRRIPRLWYSQKDPALVVSTQGSRACVAISLGPHRLTARSLSPRAAWVTSHLSRCRVTRSSKFRRQMHAIYPPTRGTHTGPSTTPIDGYRYIYTTCFMSTDSELTRDARGQITTKASARAGKFSSTPPPRPTILAKAHDASWVAALQTIRCWISANPGS